MLHQVGTEMIALSVRDSGHCFDVAGSDWPSLHKQLTWHEGRVRDDAIALCAEEMITAKAVLPVVLGKAVTKSQEQQLANIMQDLRRRVTESFDLHLGPSDEARVGSTLPR